MMLTERISTYLGKSCSRYELSEEARFLLHSDVMKEAFEQLENDILEQFMSSKPEEAEKREELHRQLYAFSKLKDRLQVFSSTLVKKG